MKIILLVIKLILINFYHSFVFTKFGFLLKKNVMKKGVHPENYRLVAFKDMSNGETLLLAHVLILKKQLK